jgi:BirA family biotin operon repressor/biotin-[acetyl-CoA-carboxylase] ligase
MTSAPPAFAAAFAAAATRVHSIDYDLSWFPTVTSTMDVAQEAARTGASEGTVIVADAQTAGRGRRGRIWSSPPAAGLYLSFIFHPPLSPGPTSALPLFTLAAGVAVRAAIAQASGLMPDVKWPNDVVVGRRKLAGILTEGIDVGTARQTIILGVGINILAAAYSPEIALRATSLEAELGRAVDRAPVLEELLVAVAERYDRLRSGNTDDILREWREASPSARGARVTWQVGDGVRQGLTSGVDDDGALRVETETGMERVISGELIWLED